MLELPKTIRTANEDEVPKGSDAMERLKAIEFANIEQGFVLSETERNKQTNFDFYAEININNSSFWELFTALSDILPSECALLIGYVDSDPNFCNYSSKSVVLSELEKFHLELSLDPFLEFGLIFQTKENTIEIYVDRTKYIKVWGTNKTEFLLIMSKFNLPANEELNFIDEFPMVSEALRLFEDNTREPNEVIESLTSKFL